MVVEEKIIDVATIVAKAVALVVEAIAWETVIVLGVGVSVGFVEQLWEGIVARVL